MITKIITINKNNIDKEDLCCAKSMDKKNSKGVNLKKQWMIDRFKEGLKFKKIQSSAKIFIEYIPAEYAWRPVEASGYMCIHCLWVSGSAKGKGYASALLEECEKDSKNMNGIVVVSSKKPFTTYNKIFLKHGYEICDKANPYFELLVKKFKKNAPTPEFKENAKKGIVDKSKDLLITYSSQCPYANYYANEMAIAAANKKIPFKAVPINDCKAAQNSATPYGSFGIFYDGKFVSHIIMSQSGFEKLLTGLKLG
jgi:hypothetical protein